MELADLSILLPCVSHKDILFLFNSIHSLDFVQPLNLTELLFLLLFIYIYCDDGFKSNKISINIMNVSCSTIFSSVFFVQKC